MSKSSRSQSLPRSQKPLHEGFFAKLKRRLRISSKKSYSVGESLDGIGSTGQYMPRSSMAFNAAQTSDPIVYSDMGHNLAHSIESPSPNRNSIVCVRAESCRSEPDTCQNSKVTEMSNGSQPKMFFSSQENLANNQFVLPEESAIDLDDNVFAASVPEIMEEPGYETLEDIRKQIKEMDKKSGSASGVSEKCDIAVKTEETGNIRGQLSKTSLDSGLGSPEQGTQSPNLESEGESSESTLSSSGVKVGTKMVRSYHTVQGSPDVDVSLKLVEDDDDIYANAQIPIRKKSVKKSLNEPTCNNVMGENHDTVNVHQTTGSAPQPLSSAHNDKETDRSVGHINSAVPDGQYCMYVDENENVSTVVLRHPEGSKRDSAVPPPLPVRKYSTSEVGELENHWTNNAHVSGSPLCGGNVKHDISLVETRKESAGINSSGSVARNSSRDSPLARHPVENHVQCEHERGSDKGNCGKDTCIVSGSPTLTATGSSLTGESQAKGGNPDTSSAKQSPGTSSSCEPANVCRSKFRQGSRRGDKTVVEVSFGSVKLKEEVAGLVDEADYTCTNPIVGTQSPSSTKPGNYSQADAVPATSGSDSSGKESRGIPCTCKAVSVSTPTTCPSCAAGNADSVRLNNAAPAAASKSVLNATDKRAAGADQLSQQPRSVSPASHSVRSRSVAAHSVSVKSSAVREVPSSVTPNSAAVSHSIVQRTAQDDTATCTTLKPNSITTTTTSTVTTSSGTSGSGVTNTAGNNMGNLAMTSTSGETVVASTLSTISQAAMRTNSLLSVGTNKLGARTTQTSPSGVANPPPTLRTIECNSMDPDVLFTDEEPIHMTLQEVFASGTAESSVALAERIAQRRSRHQIDSDDILAFQESMQQLKECGWYWGPLSSSEAEHKLANKPNGSFLVRDSANENYILSITFKSSGKVHHTRIEHFKGKFSFWSQPESHGKNTIKGFIEQAMENSRNGQFKYFLRAQGPGTPPVSMYLLYPVSRFKTMRSLMHMCRFTILQIVRRDHVDCLPIPLRIKNYLKEHQYYAEIIDEDADDVVGFDQNDNQTMTHL